MNFALCRYVGSTIGIRSDKILDAGFRVQVGLSVDGQRFVIPQLFVILSFPNAMAVTVKLSPCTARRIVGCVGRMLRELGSSDTMRQLKIVDGIGIDVVAMANATARSRANEAARENTDIGRE